MLVLEQLGGEPWRSALDLGRGGHPFKDLAQVDGRQEVADT